MDEGSTAHIMQMLNESDNALYGLHKTAGGAMKKQAMLMGQSKKITVTHSTKQA